MNLADLLDEIWSVLEDVPGLHVPDDGPGVSGAVPAPYLELPEVTYGALGAGLDRIEDLGLTVVFGPANNVQVFRDALEHASTSGARSIPAALLAHKWTSCYTLRPGRAEPTIVEPRAANPQIGYVFHLDITGSA
jgi:hypothetical protein